MGVKPAKILTDDEKLKNYFLSRRETKNKNKKRKHLFFERIKA